ncbi:hypothetical protein LguiA_033587 [Lonicera macranthoides]
MPNVPTTDVSSSPVYVGNYVVLPVPADNKVIAVHSSPTLLFSSANDVNYVVHVDHTTAGDMKPCHPGGEGVCWDIFGESEEYIEGTDIHHKMHHHFVALPTDMISMKASSSNL